MRLIAHFKIPIEPKSHHPGRIPCDKRPDRDNLVKGTQDALKGFWKDAAREELAHIEVTISTF